MENSVLFKLIKQEQGQSKVIALEPERSSVTNLCFPCSIGYSLLLLDDIPCPLRLMHLVVVMKHLEPMPDLGTSREFDHSALKGSSTFSVSLMNSAVGPAGEKLGVKEAEEFFVLEIE